MRQVRRVVTLVRDNCRWEHAGQPFFSGEVEPCINGMVIALGTYFDEDVDGVVARLVGQQLEDGGWNCWVEYGSVRSSFATTIRVLEGLLAHERATGGWAESIAARRRGSPRPAGGRSHPIAPIQTAARRRLAAGEHASRQGPLHARGRRWPTQPVEHATGSACRQLVRAVGRLNDHVGTLGHAGGGAGGRRQTGDLRCRVERAKGIEPSPRAWEARVLPLNYARRRGDSSRAV